MPDVYPLLLSLLRIGRFRRTQRTRGPLGADDSPPDRENHWNVLFLVFGFIGTSYNDEGPADHNFGLVHGSSFRSAIATAHA